MWKYVYSANSKLHTTEQLAGGYFAWETYNNIFSRESPFSKKKSNSRNYVHANLVNPDRTEMENSRTIVRLKEVEND